MVSLNKPIPGVTDDYGAAPAGQDWATLLDACLDVLNAAKVELGGDLGGTALAPVVAKIAGATISGTPGTPSSSNFLRGDGTWAAASGGASPATTGAEGIVQLAGDLGGAGTTAAAPTVVSASPTVAGKIQVATGAQVTAGTATNVAVDPAGLSGIRGLAVGVNNQTGTTYTPAAGDQGKLVTLSNAAGITLTLPQDSAVTWPVGGEFTVIQIGAGVVTFAAGTGATVNAAQSTSVQWVLIRVVKTAANTWTVDTSQAIPSATSSVQGTVKLAGDLGGTAAAPTVAKVATATISGTPGTPSSSNFLRGDGTWAVPAGGGVTSFIPPTGIVTPVGSYQAFYSSSRGRGSDWTLSSTTVHAFPFLPTGNCTADTIIIYTNTAIASSTAHLGIYASNAAGTGPGSLIYDAGTVPTTATGVTTLTLGTAQAFTAGTLYWIAISGGSTAGAALWAGLPPMLISPTDAFSVSTANPYTGYSITITAGAAFPGSWGTLNPNGANNMPGIGFHRSV